MEVIAGYALVNGEHLQVRADGGYAVVEHLTKDGETVLVYEGETPEALVEFAEVMLADMGEGLVCCGNPAECEDESCTAQEETAKKAKK